MLSRANSIRTYILGLLHPSLLSGEGGYYLTTLSSAVHVLKNFKDNSVEHLRNHVKTEVSISSKFAALIQTLYLYFSVCFKSYRT